MYTDAHTHTHVHLASPPRKKRKAEKKSKADKTIEKASLRSINAKQRRFKTYNEERWRREMEVEDKRRQDKQEHEMRMMRMMRDMFQGNDYNSYSRQYDYNNY